MADFTVFAHRLQGKPVPAVFPKTDNLSDISLFVDIWRDVWQRKASESEIGSDREQSTIVGFVVWQGEHHVLTLPGTTPIALL